MSVRKMERVEGAWFTAGDHTQRGRRAIIGFASH